MGLSESESESEKTLMSPERKLSFDIRAVATIDVKEKIKNTDRTLQTFH